MSYELEQAITPKEMVDILANRRIHISERLLRKRAREIGACHVIGRTMFLFPDDITAILEASKPSPKERPLSGYSELVRMRNKRKARAVK